MAQGIPLQGAFSKIRRMLNEAQCLLLAGHTKPDGDSLGSMLGFYCALKDAYPAKRIIAYSVDKVPKAFSFLPRSGEIVSTVPWYPDVIVGFDYGDFERLGIAEEYVYGARLVTFDHHPPAGQRGDVKIVDTSFSSTCELVHAFLRQEGLAISQDVGVCLLTGIVTDTGGFAHTNTSWRTLRAAGELIQQGVSLQEIYRNVFSSKSPKVLNVWGELLNRLQTNEQYGCAYVGISYDEFTRFDITIDELSGLVSVLNEIADSSFSVFLVEYERGKVKGSLRSDAFKGVDVSVVAQALGGGGHRYAAGFEIAGALNVAEQIVFATILQTYGTIYSRGIQETAR